MRIKRRQKEPAELEITAFMNLMIVLVPVLLMSLVFSRITVLDLKLPEQSASSEQSSDPDNREVELVIRPDRMEVMYPRGVVVKTLPQIEGKHDYALLSLTLQEIKRTLAEQQLERRAITLLSEPDTDYQTLISTMDTVRSFRSVLVTSVVDAELFPEIIFGDAPPDTRRNDVAALDGGRQR